MLTTCVFFYRAAFTSSVFIERDIQRVYYPLYRFWTERVRAGHLPQWYPYDGMGEPYIASLISGTFHPSKLLYLLLPLGEALKWNLLLAYAGALGGTYLLARVLALPRGPSLLAAAAYGLSGYLVSLSNNLLYVVAAATLPWVLWASARTFATFRLRWLVGASSLLASLALVGDPQTFAVSCGCVLLLALCERPHRWRRLCWGLALVLAAGALTSVQALPSLKARGESLLGERNDALHADNFSGHPLRALEAVLGPIWLDKRHEELISGQVTKSLNPFTGNVWTASQHVGAVVLLMAVLALMGQRRRPAYWAGAGFALVMGWLWLGSFGGLYPLFHRFVPLWKSFRYPEKLTPFVLLPLALGAAAGLAQALREPRWRRRSGLACLGLGGVIGLLLGAEVAWGSVSNGFIHARFPLIPAPQLVQLSSNVLRCGAVTLGALLCAGGGLLLPLRDGLASAVVVLAVFANFFVLDQGLYWVTAPSVISDRPGFVQIIDAREGQGGGLGRFRIRSHVGPPARGDRPPGVASEDVVPLQVAAGLRADVGALFDFETYEAYLPLPSARMRRGLVKNRFIEALLNTKYVTVLESQVPELALPETALLAREAGYVLAVLPDVTPRAYLARPRCVSGYDEASELMNTQAFVFGKEAAVECGAERPAVASEAPLPADLGSASLLEYAPERVRVNVKAVERSVLILNDAYYAGWSATVDGKSAPILPANKVVRAVWVDPGEHQVELVYQTPGLREGMWMSGLTLALLAALVTVEAWALRRPRGTRAA